MDGDLQDPPELIVRRTTKAAAEEIDTLHNSQKKERKERKLAKRLFIGNFFTLFSFSRLSKLENTK